MTLLPKWDQLPQLELYLDQVLLYVNQVTSSAISQKEKPLTAAMINNYVKHGMIAKPIKKKYGQAHIARLIVLTLCKSVFQIPDIAAMINKLSLEKPSEQLFDDMMDCFNGQERTDIHPLIVNACATIQAYQHTLCLATELEDNHEL